MSLEDQLAEEYKKVIGKDILEINEDHIIILTKIYNNEAIQQKNLSSSLRMALKELEAHGYVKYHFFGAVGKSAVDDYKIIENKQIEVLELIKNASE